MRADKYCAEKYGSRTKAAEAIERGEVLVNKKRVKPSEEIKEGDEVEFLSPAAQFVSNGGYKLARAVEVFNFDCKGKIFADIGASTGGFTDCLLRHGARKIYCVDVGESLLHERLAGDNRIISMENTNARYLTAEDFPDSLDGAVIDVSFISLRLILPVLYGIVKTGGEVLALIKPQFECADKKLLPKSGVITDKKLRSKIVSEIYDHCVKNRLFPQDIVNAPLRERKNVEYVIRLKKDAEKYMPKEQIVKKAENLL